MSDLDLFADDDGAADVPPQAAPAPVVAEKVKCGTPYVPGLNYCRVGGGLATLSDNMGRTWFCRAHAPPGFFRGR